MTSKCNFKCKYCYRQFQDIEDAPDLDITTITTLINRFPTIEAVCICGFGEPLLSDNLVWIIQTLKNNNKFTGLITNGSLLTEKLPVLIHHNSVPNYISVSLNAPNADLHEKFSGTKSFDKVLEGIKFSLESGIETYVSFICSKDNFDQVPEFARLAHSLNVTGIHLHNVLPHFKEENNKNFWDLVLQKKDKHLIDEIKKMPESKLVKTFPILVDQNETRRNCIFPWGTIAVDGNGNISVCNSVYPCEAKNGNITDPVLWCNDYCLDMRKSILTEQKDACKKCFRNWQM
jgi:MoaA/NifB/PqqE/SkfB family radical SAM enzyme